MATPNTNPKNPQAPKPQPANPQPVKSKPATAPVQSKYTAPAKVNVPRGNQSFLFDQNNYKWMIGGIALILLGFLLMSGGKSTNPHQFNYNEIYSFRRITLAPIIMLIGFGMEVYAIMKRPVVVQQS
ncbi:MAG: DUF3098 domain-containing protein [Taibaiella sp.]|nr:DUF3098 domain-containing protein [Taibaiella sp.]